MTNQPRPGASSTRATARSRSREGELVLSSKRSPRRYFARRGLARGACRVAARLLWTCTLGCGGSRDSGSIAHAPTPAATARNASLVLPEVNLGVVERGGKRELVTRLSNPTDRSMQWTALRTSCDCLSVIAAKNSLEPSDDVFAKISYDGGERPEFVGNLAVAVTALAPDGAEVFRFDVRAQIVPEEELAFCDEAKP